MRAHAPQRTFRFRIGLLAPPPKMDVSFPLFGTFRFRDYTTQAIPRPRQGVALIARLVSATPWRGRISLSGSSFPRSSALRASTRGLNSEDPSGASPLRDRQAVAVGLGSVDRIAQRQGLSLLYFKAQMRHPCGEVRRLFVMVIYGNIATRNKFLKST